MASQSTAIWRTGLSWKVLGVPLLLAGLLAVGASGAGVAHAAPTAPKVWTPPTVIPSAQTDAAPALVEFDGLLYAVWVGKPPGPYHLWYSAFNGTSWTPQKTVPSALTTEVSGPALAVYHGDLYLAWIGQPPAPYHLWYSAFNGTTWSAQAKVPSAVTGQFGSVALATYSSKLYLEWSGQSSLTTSRVWYSAFDGASWSAQTKVPSSTVGTNNGEIALAAYGTELVASWEYFHGTTSYPLQYAVFNGSTWTKPKFIAATGDWDTGPALAAFGSVLYIAWVTYNGTNYVVQFATFNGTSWTTSPTTIPSSQPADLGPAMAGYNVSLFVAWDAGEPGPIDYQSGP
jgi:hypothetical protein